MMTKHKHTPGPWHVCEGNSHLISDAHHMTVAEARQIVSGNLRTMKTEYVPGHQMQAANARLIAAAPELLEALRGFLEMPYPMAGQTMSQQTASDIQRHREVAREAILKASSSLWMSNK